MPSRRFRARAARAAAPVIGAMLAAGLVAWAGEARAQDATIGANATSSTDTTGLGLRGLVPPEDVTGSIGASDDTKGDPEAPNYGKRRPKINPASKYAGDPKLSAHSLPPLVPYSTAPGARSFNAAAAAAANAQTEGSLGVTPLDPAAPAPSIATIPTIPAKTKPKVETDPYAAVGIDIGSLRLVPYVEGDSGYDSNPDHVTSGAKGSPTLRGETGFALQSDWSVHQLTGELHAGYTDYTKDPTASRPDANGKLDLRLDASHDIALDFEVRGTLSTQSPSSPELATGSTAVATNFPLVEGFGATAGVTETLGDATLGLHGTIDRTLYEDAKLSNGTLLPLSIDDYTDYGVQARAGYAITPGVIPFVELDVDTRQRDNPIDSLGFARDSNGIGVQAGSSFELTRTLTGQISGGYAERTYTDARLGHLAGPTINSSLVWSATPLTTVTLKGTTTLADTTIANASGSIDRTISLDVSHALLRNLTLDALASYENDQYSGVDLDQRTYVGTFSAIYSLSRSVVLRASYSHQWSRANDLGSNYTDNIFLVGLKLQR